MRTQYFYFGPAISDLNLNLIFISLQIAELQGVGGFRPPGLTDLKNPGLNRVKVI